MQNHDDARDRDRDRNSSEDAFWSAALLGSLSRSRTSSHQSFSISLTSVARSIVFLVGVVLGIVLIGPVVRTIIPTRSVVRLSVASTPLTQIGTGTLVITTTKAAISAVVAPDTLTNMYPGASETVQVTVQNVGTVPLQPTLAISGSTNAVSVAADPCNNKHQMQRCELGEEAICRICQYHELYISETFKRHKTDFDPAELLVVCNCTGTAKYIHRTA
jgi:hypothetical protein